MNIFQKVMVKSWVDDDHARPEVSGLATTPPGKVGLRFFLFVVSVLFFLLTASYFMRMSMADWQKLPLPSLLVLNTAVLVAASFALQWGRNAAHAGDLAKARQGLLLGGILTFGFLGGQYAVWQDLMSLGYFASSNPSNSFFYLFTGVHALHMAGGLVAWARAMTYAREDDADIEEVALRADLGASYWHYLLLIWFYVYGLLLLT